MDTQTVTAHIPKSLVAQVDRWAAQHDRPRGWVIKEALAEWVALEEERHRLTLEGLADVDAGRLIDHEAVARWVESLATVTPGTVPTP
jgi:predicted transcriptional regulator